MATGSVQYGTTTSITITYASLANDAWRQSDVVDNTTNCYLDALVGGQCALNGTLGASDGQLEIYAYGSYDGTTFTGVPGTTDATITWGTNTSVNGYMDLKFLGTAQVDTTDTSDYLEFGPFSVATAFGGTLPKKWGIVIRNYTGASLNATQTTAELKYTGVKLASA